MQEALRGLQFTTSSPSRSGAGAGGRDTDATSMAFWNRIWAGAWAPITITGPTPAFFDPERLAIFGSRGGRDRRQLLGGVQFLENLARRVKGDDSPEVRAAIDTLEEQIDTAIDRSATLSEIEDLLGDVQQNIEAIKTNVADKIEDYVTDSVDLFSALKHPQQHGQPFAEWWWFDTCTCAERQVHDGTPQRIVGRDSQRAYALGYLTHYGADSVGHPFVNTHCGRTVSDARSAAQGGGEPPRCRGLPSAGESAPATSPRSM